MFEGDQNKEKNAFQNVLANCIALSCCIDAIKRTEKEGRIHSVYENTTRLDEKPMPLHIVFQ